MRDRMIEVGIGNSQNWDPEKAAEEAITQALAKIGSTPDFVMFFSTIHYKNNEGFIQILPI